jgi:hypothetical protein
MKTIITICLSAIILGLSAQLGIAQRHAVYVGPTLSQGYDMAVNTSNGQTSWLHDRNGFMEASYPANQTWGFVMITYGPPSPNPSTRQVKNFSNFRTITVEMKGKQGGEIVEIGLKDKDDPDNGSETKIRQPLTNNWQPYTYTLSSFRTADLNHLYVIIEFVFSGPRSETIFFRNVTFN